MRRAATLEALAAIREARPAALATLLDGEDAGAKLYVDADGTAGGARRRRTARAQRRAGGPRADHAGPFD